MALFNTEMNSKFVYRELIITLLMRLHATIMAIMHYTIKDNSGDVREMCNVPPLLGCVIFADHPGWSAKPRSMLLYNTATYKHRWVGT